MRRWTAARALEVRQLGDELAEQSVGLGLLERVRVEQAAGVPSFFLFFLILKL